MITCFRNRAIGWLIILCAIGVSACRDEVEPKQKVTLIGFSPQAGGESDLITITGTNFAGRDKLVVNFGAYYASVVSANENELVVQLPNRMQTCGKVSITVKSDTTTMVSQTQFELACPLIENFTPTSGNNGDIITINGAYFTSEISRIKVTIGNMVAQVISASTSVINAKLQQGYSGNYQVKVEIEQKSATSSNFFTITGPVITQISSQTINGCDTFVISGTGFSATASENSVSIGYLKADVVSASPTQLVITPPFNLKELIETNPTAMIFVAVDGKIGVSPTSLTIDLSSWKKIASLGARGRWRATGFGIGGKGYAGTGTIINDIGYAELLNDFWEYGITTGQWTRKADFPGVARLDAVGFRIGEKGYVGLGGDHSNVLFKDLWQYSPASDSWQQMPDFPGEARAGAIAFSVGDVGYVGMGWGFGSTNDLWKFDPTNQQWTKETEYPGAGSDGMVCFVVNDKAYIGSGFLVNDFWEYTPASKTWRQLQNIPEPFVHHGVSFTHEDVGIMATGGSQNGDRIDHVWKYESSADRWIRLPDYGGEVRTFAVGFSLGSTFAIGSGSTSYNIDETNDFYEYNCP